MREPCLDAALLEVRQDLIASPAEAEAEAWAARLAPVLADVADEGATHR